MDLCSSSYQKFSLNWSSASFDDLPDGLVTDILSRLPVKTLVQSTSVSKIWYSIIKSPSFISAHFSHSIDDPSNYYILLIHTFSPSVIVVSDNHLLTYNPDLNFHFETQSGSRKVIGTCNGLVCLTDSHLKYHGRDIYLINPFIHKYKKLAVESSCYADLIARINRSTGNIQVGFGYSEDENDYKVVRILNLYSGAAKVEIYSLKSRTWKGIDASFEIPPDRSPIFVHGCLYWCLLLFEDFPLDDPLLPDGHLLCFDLKDEVFSKIKLPTIFFEHWYTGKPSILDKNGSVAVALDPGDNDTSMRFCLLVLENDIGRQVLWKELYYDKVDINPIMCMGFSVRGRLIFVDWNSYTRNMVAIDLDNSCAIEELALDHSDRFSEALNVVESLILFSD